MKSTLVSKYQQEMQKPTQKLQSIYKSLIESRQAKSQFLKSNLKSKIKFIITRMQAMVRGGLTRKKVK